MPILDSINKPVGRFMGYTAKNWFAKTLENGYKHPAKYAASMMVLSIVSKDVINCGFYTYQSLHNKEIAPEKRKFVAANDLMLGWINVLGQMASFFLFDRFITPKIEAKFFTGNEKDTKTDSLIYKYTKAPLAQDNIRKLAANAINGEHPEYKEKGLSKEFLSKEFENISKGVIKNLGHKSAIGLDIATGFGIVISSLATMALIKRTISPLFATPLAEKLADKWDKEEEEKKSKKRLDIIESKVAYSKTPNLNDKTTFFKKNEHTK